MRTLPILKFPEISIRLKNLRIEATVLIKGKEPKKVRKTVSQVTVDINNSCVRFQMNSAGVVKMVAVIFDQNYGPIIAVDILGEKTPGCALLGATIGGKSLVGFSSGLIASIL